MAKNNIRVYRKEDPLTQKQKAWIDYVLMGKSRLEATRLAGYKGNDNTLNQVGIENEIRFKDLLAPRLKEVETKRTLELQEIFDFWSNTINDTEQRMSDRIRCAELLAKAKGAFIERIATTNIDNTAFKELTTDELRKLIADD